MKIKSTYTVELKKAGDEPAFFTFRKEPLNKQLDDEENIDEQTARENFQRELRNLIKVEGLSYEDGTAITAEDLQELEIPIEDMLLILAGIRAYRRNQVSDFAKNVSSAE